jgi:RNA polymerase sigma factor (sigma-70 family)
LSPVLNAGNFRDFYKDYYQKIFNYVFRHLFHREHAEDVTSHIFYKAFAYVKKNSPDLKNSNAWIYRIATNCIINFHRKKRAKIFISIDDSKKQIETLLFENTNTSIMDFEELLSIKQALLALSPAEQTLFELFFYEKLSYKEISRIFHKKESALRSRIHRIVKKLKERLQ